MNKSLLLLPLTAVAILIVWFLMSKRHDEATGLSGPVGILKKVDPATAAEMARLRDQLNMQKQENEKLRQRVEAAEAKLALATAEAEPVASAVEPKKAVVKNADWKTRRDAELEAKVKSIEWRKRIKGLVDYWKELEKSRAEGRAPHMTPEMTDQLMRLQGDAVELAKLLGLENDYSYKAFQNEVVGAAWMDAFMQELTGGTLTDDQLAKLRTTDLYKDDGSSDDPNRNLLETWHKLIEHNREYGTQTAGILSADQHAQVTSAVSPAFMLSVYASYSERTLSGADAVAGYWIKSFTLPVEQAAAVNTIAAEYVRRQAEIAQAVSTQYGGLKSREAEFELLLKSIEAQMAAEKKLSETLNLTPDQLKLFLKGSGAVIRISN